MVMKDGTAVPQLLLQALEKDIYALKVFMSMSETYQKLLILQVTGPQATGRMRERLNKAIRSLHKYGEENRIAKN